MNSRERVLRAIEFKQPDRLPVCFLTNKGNEFADIYGNDIIFTSYRHFPDRMICDNRWIDEWGCEWKKTFTSIGQAQKHVLTEWEDLDDYKIPPHGDMELYHDTSAIVSENPNYFIVGDAGGGLYYNMTMLRGVENLWADLYLEPDNVYRLLGVLIDYNIKIITSYGKIGVDGIIIWDDQGMQDRLAIKPELWRSLLKPAYKRLVDQAHRVGMKFIMHTCGYITDILDDLIEIGVDVLQLDQQFNMGLSVLSDKCRGRVCLFSPYDVQRTASARSTADLQAGVDLMIRCFDKSGGLIAKLYPQPDDVGITDEIMHVLCRTFTRKTL